MTGKLAPLCMCLALVTGCGSGNPGNANVKRDIERGLAEIQSGHDRRTVQANLTDVVARSAATGPNRIQSNARGRSRSRASRQS